MRAVFPRYWLLSLILVGGLNAQDTFCPQVANYFMDVTLDTQQDLITGKEWVTWTNTSQSPAFELWFHLYWNAFQNNRSTFLREGGESTARWEAFEAQDWGYCRIASLHIIENQEFEAFDLTPRLRFRQPDDANTFDQTVCSVRLPQPVAPGQTLDLVVAFSSKVPRPVSRTGVYGDYYFVAQWFPKLGVFSEGIWNCHQYHRFSEYFADFGTYDVKITLPSTYQVEGTGEHREQISNGDGTSTHRFYQHSVHDFAWAASPVMLRFSEDFMFAPGKSTQITLLLQPYHLKLKERYLAAVRNALHYASLWLGDYPYSTITCVDPAYNSRSGGMEYPTLFTGGAYFLSPRDVHSPEGVTIHEFGHGYFYGLLGSNEFEHAWMDEGMTSYLETKITYTAYGEPAYSRFFFGVPVTFPRIRIPLESVGISSHRTCSDIDVLQRPAWRYMNGRSYGANAYAKAQLLMLTLRRFLGEEVFDPMLKAYSTRWWWKHPRPQDFYAVVSEFAGQDMSWFLDQFVFGSGRLDYAVAEVSNRVVPPQSGLFGGKYKKAERPRSQEVVYDSKVLIHRRGPIKVPVNIRVWFADGSSKDVTWDGQYRWKKLAYRSESPIIRVVVDPDFIYVLDVNRRNNSWTSSPSRLAPWKWTGEWLHWLQHALEFFTHLGG